MDNFKAAKATTCVRCRSKKIVFLPPMYVFPPDLTCSDVMASVRAVHAPEPELM
jgi:hypothetical protein